MAYKNKICIKKIGLVQLNSDNCVFFKSNDDNFLILCMYVDDLGIFCYNNEINENTVSKIN